MAASSAPADVHPGPGRRSHPADAAPFQRVKAYLKTLLARGHWAAGDLMPSEAELVQQFQVSRMTVSRALRELQAEGLVSRVQGVGTFASSLHPVSSSLTLRDVQEEIESRGHRHHARVFVQEQIAANDQAARDLGLSLGSPVFRTLIVHFENGLALQCEDRLVNPLCAPDYLLADFSRTTPTQYLFEHTALWSARYAIESACPRPQEARLLGISPQEPCLVVVRRTFTREHPITVARLVYPGSRYRFQGAFEP